MDTTADCYMYAGVRMIAEHLGTILTWLKDGATIVIAGATLWFIRRQWRTDERRLKYEQYERRAYVFRGVLVHLEAVSNKDGLDYKDLRRYWRATSEKEFHFEPEFNAYLNEIQRRSVEFLQHNREMLNTPIGDAKKASLVERHDHESRWFLAEREVLRDRFDKYLSVR